MLRAVCVSSYTDDTNPGLAHAMGVCDRPGQGEVPNGCRQNIELNRCVTFCLSLQNGAGAYAFLGFSGANSVA